MTIVVYDLAHTLRYDLSDPAQAARAWDEVHTVATLQGLVNRKGPRLYVRFVEYAGCNIDDFWLDHATRAGGWLDGAERKPVYFLEDLLSEFRDDFDGVVVYDPRVPATSNVASSLAGAEDLVAVRADPSSHSVYERLVSGGLRLPIRRQLVGNQGIPQFSGQGLVPGTNRLSSGSAKCDAYLWAIRELLETGRCNPAYLAYYIDCYWIGQASRSVPNQHTLTNHDYFVAQRAFFCDLDCWGDEAPVDDPDQPCGTDRRTLQAILRALYERSGGGILHVGGFSPWAFKYTDQPGAGGTHRGVPTEWELVRMASAYNGFIDADAIAHGAMANASFFMHFPLEDSNPQARWPTTEDLTARGYLDATTGLPVRDRDFVMFYVGDYDSAAWLYQRVPDLWEDPRRGEVPLSWAISPVLARRAPMVMDHLWRTRSDNDFFMSADNGAGYLNPTMLTEPRPISSLPCGLAAWADHCHASYAQWDMAVTGFVIDGNATPTGPPELDAYARFSPRGVVLQHLDRPAALHGEVPVLRRGPDVLHEDPQDAVAAMRAFIHESRQGGIRFHWFRSVLKSPSWHAGVAKELRRTDASVEWVGADVFFELLRRRLAAEGDES